jgi:hypothetical protein
MLPILIFSPCQALLLVCISSLGSTGSAGILAGNLFARIAARDGGVPRPQGAPTGILAGIPALKVRFTPMLGAVRQNSAFVVDHPIRSLYLASIHPIGKQAPLC